MVAFLFWPQKKPIASIKSALSDAQEIACDYVDSDGLTTKTYTKAGMLRSDFSDAKPEDAGSVLIRDGKTYVWWTKDKEGFFAASADDNSKQKDQLVNDMEKYKKTCKPAVVPDNLFILPTDIHFRDYYRKANPAPTETP